MWALADSFTSLNRLSRGVWGMAEHWEDAWRVRLPEEAPNKNSCGAQPYHLPTSDEVCAGGWS